MRLAMFGVAVTGIQANGSTEDFLKAIEGLSLHLDRSYNLTAGPTKVSFAL